MKEVGERWNVTEIENLWKVWSLPWKWRELGTGTAANKCPIHRASASVGFVC